MLYRVSGGNPLLALFTKIHLQFVSPLERGLKGYVHDFVNHTKKEYARGDVHENRAECLFSLLKPYLRVFRASAKPTCRAIWASFSSCGTFVN